MPSLTLSSGRTVNFQDDCYREPWEDCGTVVLLHGNAESSKAWTCWIPTLARYYRVLRPDMNAFDPLCIEEQGVSNFNHAASNVIEFLDRLEITRFHLAGAKHGGIIALIIASLIAGRVATLTLLGVLLEGRGDGNLHEIKASGIRAWADRTMLSRLGTRISEAQRAWWIDLMANANFDGVTSTSASRSRMSFTQLFSQLDTPTLIVTGTHSSIQSPEDALAIARLRPLVEIRMIDSDAFHVAASHPDECAGHTLEFIRSRDALEANI